MRPAAAPRHLILLHGGGVGPWMWADTLARLDPGLTVHAPTLPGHDAAADGIFLDHRDAARSVAEQTGLDVPGGLRGGVTVAGFSLGGQTALALAEAFPDRVDRLVVISSLVEPLPGGDRLAQLGAAATPLAGRAWFARAQAAQLGLPEALLPEYLRLSRSMPRESVRNLLAANFSFRAPAAVLEHPRPTLLLAGDREQRALLGGLGRAAARLPNGRLALAHGGRHGIVFSHPERFAARLGGFLAEPA